MLIALGRPPHLLNAISALLPQLAGSFLICGIVALLATLLGLIATMRPLTTTLTISLLSFLVGGQLLALGSIHLLNRPLLFALYDSPVGVILVHLALLAWVNLLIARQFYAGHWAQLRLASASDGASPAQTLFRILLPATWRWHLAGAIMVFCLSLGETSAVMILQPPRPQMLMPTLMTWVHMLRNDAMIEGALLLASIIMVAVVLVALLSWRRVVPLLLVGLLLVSGCGPSDKPDAVWGPPGTGPHPMVYPRGIAYAPKTDEFFIVDRTARIQRLDHNGAFVCEWQMPAQANGKPVGISIGPDGNVYVPDTHYHRVIVYTPDGQLLRQWGSEGKAPGQFIFPTDIAFDSAGNIFVSEYGDNDRIQVFSPAGEFLYQFGSFGQGDGEVSRPQSMVIDGDTLYITDACNHRIAVFTTKGKFLRNMGQSGSAPGQFRFPYGLDDDGQGNLLVTEFGNNRVQKIAKSDGHAIATWGTTGRAEGELAYPWAGVIDKRGRAVIVDSGNNRLQVVKF
jgi:DNA-binding beta-propeller fold protein YncE/ABC-type spermidine/putrescine transport system permease subunit II